MLLLTYRGCWVETSAQHPESFTLHAPDTLQRECIWFPLWPCPLWETAFYGYPRFRVVLVDSRFQIAGSQQVTFLDDHGNWRTCHPAEVLIPRYRVGPEWCGRYILEMWRPAAWYFKEGYADPAKAVIHGPNGKGIRRREPVWDQGAWEAIENGGLPLWFNRDVSGDMIRWAIWCLHRKFDRDLRAKPKVLSQTEYYWQQHEQEKLKFQERFRERRPTLPGPMVAVPGPKENLWKAESCALAAETT